MIEESTAAIDTSSTFLANMKLPVHSWFRYSAGFSAQWVKQVIKDLKPTAELRLYDPFAGSGTTIIAGQEAGISAVGLEAHPFVLRVAKAKLQWQEDIERFCRFAETIREKAAAISPTITGYPNLIYKCFPENSLAELDAIRRAWTAGADGSPASELCWLAITAMLRSCSPVGTAQMELIQPKKQKQRYLKPLEAFSLQIDTMQTDMSYFQRHYSNASANIYATANIYQGDARDCLMIPDSSVNLVITSPPYANNFDYADATRLEMSFWGEVQDWKELHGKVRQYLVRSCSQHMSHEKAQLDQLLAAPQLTPIAKELREVCEQLAAERLLHNGKKDYHLMIAGYFSDLARVWAALRRVCMTGSRICFVVGDSAPYGVYVPVHKWLGELALANGFNNYYFEKRRDRNIKWKNRKHRVPLCEGHLWVSG